MPDRTGNPHTHTPSPPSPYCIDQPHMHTPQRIPLGGKEEEAEEEILEPFQNQMSKLHVGDSTESLKEEIEAYEQAHAARS